MVSDVAARMIRFFNVNEPIFPVVRYDLVCSIGLLPWPGANRDVRALLRQHLRDRIADAFAPAGYDSPCGDLPGGAVYTEFHPELPMSWNGDESIFVARCLPGQDSDIPMSPRNS